MNFKKEPRTAITEQSAQDGRNPRRKPEAGRRKDRTEEQLRLENRRGIATGEAAVVSDLIFESSSSSISPIETRRDALVDQNYDLLPTL